MQSAHHSHPHMHTLSVPAAHHHAPSSSSSVLLLIENSLAMAAIWSDIRQRCLEPLLRDFDEAKMKVLAVETLPVPSSPLERGGVHQGGLDSIRFNGSPNNRLSTAKVNAAIDLLLNSNSPYGGDQSHLVLVAASAPIDNPLLGIRQYAWFLLAEKLQKANISCHLVLARNGEDMSSLIGLYDKTRWLQGALEVHSINEDGKHVRHSVLVIPHIPITLPPPA
ncbi:hypothetical protein FA13DRAFT_259565 [Coprinellus micaceus]|uniref:Mediator of RNA polymerase II transcription subunit 25 n=1 Tax=Coprinellus micaceus TaxID=71717 RepID=A0A4Y7TET7_COPMI|nr:hypothetical protein FA13DRAFT_259565 [Coprinellus micaceus]